MAETYGELICRLCQLRDQMKQTPRGRAALEMVRREVGNAAALERHGIDPATAWETGRQFRVTDRKEKLI